MVISENCCTFIVSNYKVVQTIIAMFFTSFRRRRNTEDKVAEIFFMADEFHKVFCRMLDKYSLNAPKIAGKRSYHRAGKCGRQGVYQQEALPEALRGRHSAHHKTKEQYERCSDERFGQSATA